MPPLREPAVFTFHTPADAHLFVASVHTSLFSTPDPLDLSFGLCANVNPLPTQTPPSIINLPVLPLLPPPAPKSSYGTTMFVLYSQKNQWAEIFKKQSPGQFSFFFLFFSFLLTPAVVSRSGNYKDRPASTCSHTRTYIHTVPVYSRTRTKPCSQKHTCAPFLHTRSHASHCSFLVVVCRTCRSGGMRTGVREKGS